MLILNIASSAKWSDGYSFDGKPLGPISSLLGKFNQAIGTKPFGL